ncbi:MAG TPA: methyltransferase [Alphaproteobacteria bacterium]
MAEEDTTEDGLLGGSVRLIQQAGGYRVAIDPVLLAAAVPAAAGDHVLDAGAGVAAAALCLAARVPGVRVSGIESQRALVRLANDNADLNGMKDRVAIMEGDLLRPPPRLAPGGFDHVMANPPYLEPARASISPDAGKAAAGVEGAADLGAWVAFCLTMVRDKGSVTVIHRADRLDALLTAFHRKAGEIVVYPLWPVADGRPAKRVVVRARKGLASPMRLAAGLVLHRADGTYTPEAEAILRHGASLDL